MFFYYGKTILTIGESRGIGPFIWIFF